ncbi:AlbA family DNA-binding domain-containing protein [Halostagnicola kamekurae]|uniref:Putative DNA-binding domain-containing protein n=1 Tax=Halostagnicola kamekurae TaxID=619731 RepID=A0A1I6V5Q8_9EURY|nr:ATP-binding protein [Halostagnicola kamekurae]SFT08954.1 Putative DNA-binding domain-containing protein [Halostagnicola kamekurae]
MINYNPFEKPLSEIDSDDIYELDVPEGYYYEYKRSLIGKEDIAKSVSSFANTYGGLLFLGVEENDDTNKPEDRFTLSNGDSSKYKETVRNAVKEYVSPPPRFTTHTFDGFSEDGGEGYVILVDVPESQITPHINNNGCVYRRTGEGSDPYRPLTDPGVLDDLHNRREQWQERVEEFCQTEVGLTNAHAGDPENDILGIPMLEVYGIPTTLDEPVCSDVRLDLDGFRDAVQSSNMYLLSEDRDGVEEDESIKMGVDADTYRATSEGVVAQQWTTYDEDGYKDRAHTPLTIKFFADGSAKFFMPLPTIPFPEPSDQTVTWEVIDRYLDSSHENIQFIDGENTLLALYNHLNIYMNLLSTYGWPEESNNIYVKARLINGYRTMLFFESDWYQELVQDYGAPVCYDDVVEAPRMNPFQYEIELSKEDRFSSVLYSVVSIFQAFGLPLQNSTDLGENFTNSIFQNSPGEYDGPF